MQDQKRTMVSGEGFVREVMIASELALEAGKILMKHYNTDYDIESKGADGPVTIADKEANDFLVNAIRKNFPHDGVVAEESPDQSEALAKRRCWFIDPMDGTKEFIKKNGEFSVMIGLAVEGTAKVGVVYQPAKDKLYEAAEGLGATLRVDGVAKPLSVSKKTDSRDMTMVISRSHRSPHLDTLIDRIGIAGELIQGSVGLKCGRIAEREADFYVHITDKSSRWDSCAPEAIIRAAGGVFTDLSGADFDYTVADMQNHHGIFACNASAYDAILPAVRQIGKESGFI